MANTITDNRTQLANADGITDGVAGSWTGTSSPTADADVFIEGTGSISENFTNSVRTIMWNRGTTINLTNTHIYIWVNCGVVGRLTSKATGGFRVRFAGPTITDYFEAYVGGNDSWPNATAGGWVQFVVDVGAVSASPSATGGTPPAVSAIQHIGVAGITSAMTKVADNTWVDSIWSLADGTPGIIVQGRNGGTTPWASADILTQLGASRGCFRLSDGGAYVINTPIQFGVNDTTTHEFTDTNAVWLWDNQEWAAADLYNISALGNAGGTTNVKFGAKTGTGNAATGAQGLTIAAASSGVRWGMDFDDPNLDAVGLYGCSFQHGATFQLDDAAIEVISSLYIDCQKVQAANSLQLRNGIINAATADDIAFMVTDDMGDIRFCSFQFSDGHAIEITSVSPATQNNVGNLFNGYTNTAGSTDAAVLKSAAGALTISSSDGSDLQTDSYDDAGGGGVTIQNNISVTFTGMKDNTEVRIYTAGTSTELAGIESATSGTTDNRSFTASLAAATSVDYTLVSTSYEIIRVEAFSWPTSASSIPIQQRVDRNFSNP